MGHSHGVGVNLQWTQAVEAVEPEVSCTSDILQPQELVYIPWALSSLPGFHSPKRATHFIHLNNTVWGIFTDVHP